MYRPLLQLICGIVLLIIEIAELRETAQYVPLQWYHYLTSAIMPVFCFAMSIHSAVMKHKYEPKYKEEKSRRSFRIKILPIQDFFRKSP